MAKFTRVAVPALLLLLAVPWGTNGFASGPSSITNAPYVLTPAGLPPSEVISGLEGPLHDWTVGIRGRAYGLKQWGRSDCSIYLGRLVKTWNLPATHIALITLSVAALSCVLAWKTLMRRQ